MEQTELKIARRSAMTYSAISLTVALIFLIVATLTGYDAVARFGGAIWVFMLSMIVTMPVVTSRFKRARTEQPQIVTASAPSAQRRGEEAPRLRCAGKAEYLMADFSLRLGAEAAVQLATAALERQQLRAVRNFDLRGALQSQNSPCTCPHHGTTDCQCNYVVLLAYDMAASNHSAQPAGKIVIHSHDGTTWLSVPTPNEEPQVQGYVHRDQRLLRAVAEVMFEAAI